MAEIFTSLLRRRGDRIWRAIHGHAFLRELHAGALAKERFTYFILQDYLYLLDFAQVLCLGGAKSPDLATLEIFARHALAAVEVERSFHASFGKTLGFSQKQLDATNKGPVTQAYIDHLQAVARSGRGGASLLLDLRRGRQAALQRPPTGAENLPPVDRALRFGGILAARARTDALDGSPGRAGELH